MTGTDVENLLSKARTWERGGGLGIRFCAKGLGPNVDNRGTEETSVRHKNYDKGLYKV